MSSKITWRECLTLTALIALLVAATIATASDGPLFHMKGAWISKAVR
jgi:hypothetical protein